MPSCSHRQRGFTLIELMVVVGVIGVILAVAVPIYRGHKKSACDTQAANDLQGVITAITKVDSELNGCTIREIDWTQAGILESLVGYHGWGGTSVKCDVQVVVVAPAPGTIRMYANRGTGDITYAYIISSGTKQTLHETTTGGRPYDAHQCFKATEAEAHISCP